MNKTLQKFKTQRLDTISSTFCAAKWFQADVYLHTGVTSSCQFPSPHPIDFDKVRENNKAIFNTPTKSIERKLMLQGKQPSVCNNCWNIENKSSDTPSHRIYYSKRHELNDFESIVDSDDVIPEIISVVFDKLCNLTCVYCDVSQSSSWDSDIKKNGAYNLNTDERNTYVEDIVNNELCEEKYEWLYGQFVDVIVQNILKIKKINILGGEPTMSPRMWKFLDILIKHDTSNLTLGIITNLSQRNLIEKVLTYESYFSKLQLAISIDGTSKSTEFIRNGLDWDVFEQNFDFVMKNINNEVWLLGTTNILSLDALPQIIDWYENIASKYDNNLVYKNHICRWPSFQSITILPRYLKEIYTNKLNSIIKKSSDNKLIDELQQLIIVLNTDAYNDKIYDRRNDFKYFVKEFAKRKNLDIKQCFSKELSEWILEE